MTPNPKSQQTNISEVLTTGQIAKICCVDGRTVNRWIDQGILKAYQLPLTGFSRVRVEDFLDFLKNHKMPVPDELKYLTRNRVLIVDDEVGMIHAIRRVLSHPDPEALVLREAHDGFEAGKMLTEFKPDLVILDILMPGMDGLSALRRIKSDPESRRIKVMIVSAVAGEGERRKILGLGADDFLVKPFDDEDLRARVNRLLGGVS